MKGLLLRLSALDADAENAVRVISFFDGLIAAQVGPQALVRETARLAECPAGLVDTASGLSLRADPAPHNAAHPAVNPAPRVIPDGLPGDVAGGVAGDVPGGVQGDVAGGVPGDVPGGGAGVVSRGVPGGVSGGVLRVVAGDGAGGFVGGVIREVSGTACVWLGRSEPLPLDELVLERFAIAAGVLLGAAPRQGDGGLAELVLSADAGELARCRALRLLDVDPAERVHVLAVEGEIPDALGGIGAPAVSLGRVHAVLVRTPPERFPRGLRVGVGSALPAVEAPASLRRARTALRFAGMGADVVHYDGLGALAVIAARMRDEDIAAVPDVAALDALAAEPNGAGTLAVLAAFCATGSARRAAARVHRHHSTIAARLAYAEARLGFSFAAPGERRRLDLAVLLRHLRDRPE
ncbi:helix-turn-helix domain-containing protein [Spirillospora sp. NPDC047418]